MRRSLPTFLHTNKYLNLNRQSAKVTDLNAPHIIYQFTFSYGGRTDRCFGQRIGEHVPKWSVKQLTNSSPERKVSARNPVSSIEEHLMAFGHQNDTDQAFQVILRNRNPRLLAFCEALSISRLRPPLYGKTVDSPRVPAIALINPLFPNVSLICLFCFSLCCSSWRFNLN